MICLMQDGASPLFVASYGGLTEVVNLLITHGASLDKQHKVDAYCDDYDLVHFDEINYYVSASTSTFILSYTCDLL